MLRVRKSLDKCVLSTFYCLIKIFVRAIGESENKYQNEAKVHLIGCTIAWKRGEEYLLCLRLFSESSMRPISCVFSLFVVPSLFLYIAHTKAVLTGLKAY